MVKDYMSYLKRLINLYQFYNLLARNTQKINEYINLIKDE